MKKLLLLLLCCTAASAEAQNWSLGVGTGPFVFGHFVRRTTRVATPEGSATQTVTLSAATRAGLSVDIERRFGDRFAVRLEGAFTRAPLAVKGDERQDDAVDIPAGDIDVATMMLPLVVRINPRGTFRFHIMGGPAAAAYTIRTRPNAAGSIPIFRGTRTEWGGAFGAGMAWQWNENFGIEGSVVDINTSSPFRKDEIGGLGTVEIERPDNLHSTIGIRYRF
ncbi:MAG TPA: outer membrane beta-barrel protein [Thermoanaerobaculia bacterium]|nr:outer membrane beta-barrel protein [Thermoanaerobaculia bacterium]